MEKIEGLLSPKVVPIGEIKAYESNIKWHPVTQVRRIMYSIANYGWDQPIIVDEDMVIIKGHGRRLAAIELDLKEVPVVVVTHLTDAEKKAARISDNKVSESEWDSKILWKEIKRSMNEDGMTVKDLGFSLSSLRSLFKDDYDLDELGIKPTDKDVQKDKLEEEGIDEDQDPTAAAIQTFVKPFTGDEAWMRRVPLIDYIDLHDRILVGFSGGKDSLCALIWCLENCDREKVQPYFSNLGWGVDWPHAMVMVKMIEHKYDCKVIIGGPTDPNTPGRFEDLLLQYGYMDEVSCWVRNYIKIPSIEATMAYLRDLRGGKDTTVTIMAARWSESANRRKLYSDRGYFTDSGKPHYASPVLLWDDQDICQFLDDRDIFLHPAYQHTSRMGCIICPHGDKKNSVNVRKKFPALWRQWIEWFGKGARRRKGAIKMSLFLKALASLDDLTEDQIRLFSGNLSPITLDWKSWEKYVEAEIGAELFQEGYTRMPYNPEMHNFPSDVPDDYLTTHGWEVRTNKEGMMCTLTS